VCGSERSKDDGELIVSRVVSKQRFERLDEGEFFHGAGVECQTPAAREPLDHDVCRAVWQLTCPQSHAAVDSAYAWRASLPNVVHGPERGMPQPDLEPQAVEDENSPWEAGAFADWQREGRAARPIRVKRPDPSGSA
jgi:hypothetical protein